MVALILKAGSRPPWVGLAAAVWVQFASGNSYNFPLYSTALKTVLGYDQQKITLLGLANDIGESVGVLPGIACNKFPPWMILSVGAIACFLGYGLVWLAVSQTVTTLPFWALWIALCIGTNSCAWFSTAVVVTNMRNFPLSRGTVAGLLKGYVGLSAAVYTEIYSSLLDQSAEKLLLFLTIGIPALSLALMYFIRPCTPSGENSSETEHVHFLFTQAASIIVGIYLLTTTILEDVFTVSTAVSYTFIGIMVLMLMAPLAIPIKMTLFRERKLVRTRSNMKPSASEPLLRGSDEQEADSGVKDDSLIGLKFEDQDKLLHVSFSTRNLATDEDEEEDVVDVNILLAEGEGAVPEKKKRKPRRGENFNFKQAVVKADFWLLFFVYSIGVGTGVTVLNNLAQIGTAIGVTDTSILLSLFSFFNFLGRLGGGVVSEFFVKLNAIPRPTWMAVTQVIMIVAYLLYATASTTLLYVATALLGVCYGFQFTVMIPTASELFGLKHFGVIYNFMGIGNPLGALVFSVGLAGYVYDQEAAKQSSSESCTGGECFRLTFLVLAGVCVLGTLLAIVLTVRIRPVYKNLYSSGSFRIPAGGAH